MFETLFTYPRVLRRHREGPLAEERAACHLQTRPALAGTRTSDISPANPTQSPRRTRHTTAPLASISCPSRFERHHAADPGRGEFPGANGALAHPHAPQIRRRCAIRRSPSGPHATCLRNVPSNRQERWLARQGPPKHRHPRSPTARAA